MERRKDRNNGTGYLITFIALLTACVITGIDIIWALVVGMFLFAFYARRTVPSYREILKMMWDGFLTCRKVLLTFVFIGMLTASWRACGTIAYIITEALGLISPGSFLIMVFLLNSAVSFMTGTSFGCAATMGVISMSMAGPLGASAALTAGAVLSGSFFGDRCSPLSSSALLIADITQTNIYANVKNMAKDAVAPFALAALIYAIAGFTSHGAGRAVNIGSVFAEEFELTFITAVPAVVILILCLFRVDVKLAMLISTVCAVIIAVFVQGMEVSAVPLMLFSGYKASSESVAAMISGGGIMSMARVGVIVGISSSYSGIFRETDILTGIRKGILALAQKTTSFMATMVTAVISIACTCNQSLPCILCQQICEDVYEDREEFALDIEDSVIVIAPLIPWSVTSTVPIATINAPTVSVLAAFYLVLVPLWRLLYSYIQKRRNK